MKTQLSERSETKLLSEFDPPPLLETRIQIKAEGNKRGEHFSNNNTSLLKVVGGLIRRRSDDTSELHFTSVVFRKVSAY